ncbi:arylsulfatase [bacterium A37T11]|nr:arylsulfatase [bacterium A37T11]
MKTITNRIIGLGFILSVGILSKTFGQTDTSYRGIIGKTLSSSKEYWPPLVKTPAGAPNVIWILLDDTGFGASDAFGGLVHTPVFTSLANNGLRYTNFHTTGVCSPTRAAILTGRNHHYVHMGLFPHGFLSAGFPGYDAKIPATSGTIAENLREYGYSTYAVGKWHLTPDAETSDLGPFDRWPLGKGFDHFFGFLGGATDQYKPDLVEDNKHVQPDGRHLNAQLIDKSISYITSLKKAAKDRPFFLYLTPGATHSPFQVDKEWIEKYKGKFDEGWDVYRQKVFIQQKKLGIIPADAKLPERNTRVAEWKKLPENERKLYARFMESFAGFLEYTDHEIGRLIDYLKQSGQFENTAIFLVIGDNGASKEGYYNGTIANEFTLAKSDSEEDYIDGLEKNYEAIGTASTYTNYPLGWAQATNTPFKYWKAEGGTEGGSHNPLIVSYPAKLKGLSGIRNQYGHVIDLLPTTLELIDVKPKSSIKGIPQDSVQGISLNYSFLDEHAPDRRHTQYHFTFGSGSIYHDGWKASFNSRPDAVDLFVPYPKKPVNDINGDGVWELYHIAQDVTEANNLAKKEPGKLKELQGLFDQQATINHVYPLLDWKDFGLKFQTLVKQYSDQKKNQK